MKVSTKRVISILFSIVLLGAIIFVYASFISPAYDDVLRQRADLKNKDQAVIDYDNDLKRIAELTKKYSSGDLEELKTALKTIVPPEENTASAIMQLGGLALANRISLQSVGVQVTGIRSSPQPGLVKNTGTVRLLFRAGGSYEDFRKFIHGVETNLAVMDVESVKIETPPASKGGFSGVLNYTVAVLTHYEAD